MIDEDRPLLSLAADLSTLTKLENPAYWLAAMRLWAKGDEDVMRMGFQIFSGFTTADEIRTIYLDPSQHADNTTLVEMLRFAVTNISEIKAEAAKQ